MFVMLAKNLVSIILFYLVNHNRYLGSVRQKFCNVLFHIVVIFFF